MEVVSCLSVPSPNCFTDCMLAYLTETLDLLVPFLDARDVAALTLTCREIKEAVDQRSVWQTLCFRLGLYKLTAPLVGFLEPICWREAWKELTAPYSPGQLVEAVFINQLSFCVCRVLARVGSMVLLRNSRGEHCWLHSELENTRIKLLTERATVMQYNRTREADERAFREDWVESVYRILHGEEYYASQKVIVNDPQSWLQLQVLFTK